MRVVIKVIVLVVALLVLRTCVHWMHSSFQKAAKACQEHAEAIDVR